MWFVQHLDRQEHQMGRSLPLTGAHQPEHGRGGGPLIPLRYCLTALLAPSLAAQQVQAYQHAWVVVDQA
tara:strand:+ start:675 stop:881 length:207 start_codon:yes stop_codon:yes gene_type:complete